ncbi:MAG TPA: ABC transporter permease [Mycobacteriales bacterium]|nr:ABC transporter permease [Mycobacteriales bacterium]
MGSELLSFTVVGLVTGCVYALIATGLVVTYTTTGIFNFAHGAIGMAAAFMFWQLWISWHVNPVLALVLVLFVIAPLFGLVIERLLMRPLYGAPTDVTVVVTLGLLLALVGMAQSFWKPNTTHILPLFFHANGFRLGQVLVSYHAVTAIAATVAIALGLRVLFNRTRLGIAMRAVVDNPDLLAMAGGRPAQVQQFAWMLGCSLAALAGILLAPLAQLDILLLTLLVVDGYAAAIIGRLRNLPLAVLGALAIGLGQNYLIEFAPGSGFLSRIYNILPMVVLFAVLILLPQDRLRTASFSGAVAPRVAGLKSSVVWAVLLVVGCVLISFGLSPSNLRIGANGFAIALILLSLVLLTGYGGMVSLCQMTFAGLGAVMMGHLGHGGSLVGVVTAVALAAAVGALIALPTLKMRGLYLALATFAFATVMQQAVFTQLFGTGGNLEVPRPHIPGIPTDSDRQFFILTAAVFAVASVGILALRRSSFGRRLVAVNDSPAACATLGVNVNWTKLTVFTIAAGLAGLGGALVGGVAGQVDANGFVALQSLVLLLLARVGGINTATGAFLGASTLTLFAVLQPHVPQLGNLQFLLTGLAAISVGRDPNGAGGRIAELAAKAREIFGIEHRDPVVPVGAVAGTPAAVFLDEEEGRLVGAGH